VVSPLDVSHFSHPKPGFVTPHLNATEGVSQCLGRSHAPRRLTRIFVDGTGWGVGRYTNHIQ